MRRGLFTMNVVVAQQYHSNMLQPYTHKQWIHACSKNTCPIFYCRWQDGAQRMFGADVPRAPLDLWFALCVVYWVVCVLHFHLTETAHAEPKCGQMSSRCDIIIFRENLVSRISNGERGLIVAAVSNQYSRPTHPSTTNLCNNQHFLTDSTRKTLRKWASRAPLGLRSALRYL